MSLSQEPVFSRLKSRYVCGYKNISHESYAGGSGVHPVTGPSVATTNGAGPHNLQLFVLSPDGTVLHCLPGYWCSTDLCYELDLAEKLGSVWQNNSMTVAQKQSVFKQMQLEHEASHSQDLSARSTLQGFDKVHIAHHPSECGDIIRDASLINAAEHQFPDEAFKTTDKITHDRMATRPFLAYAQFDVGPFTNYGTSHYDKMENEMEGAHVAEVGRDLRSLIHDTDVSPAKAAAPPNKAASAPSPAKAAKPAPPDNTVALLKLYEQAFRAMEKQGAKDKCLLVANEVIHRFPRLPMGYEMRSKTEFNMHEYRSSYIDAWAAQRLGSRAPWLPEVITICQTKVGQ